MEHDLGNASPLILTLSLLFSAIKYPVHLIGSALSLDFKPPSLAISLTCSEFFIKLYRGISSHLFEQLLVNCRVAPYTLRGELCHLICWAPSWNGWLISFSFWGLYFLSLSLFSIVKDSNNTKLIILNILLKPFCSNAKLIIEESLVNTR